MLHNSQSGVSAYSKCINTSTYSRCIVDRYITSLNEKLVKIHVNRYKISEITLVCVCAKIDFLECFDLQLQFRHFE